MSVPGIVPGAEAISFEDGVGDRTVLEFHAQDWLPELPRPPSGPIAKDGVDLWRLRLADQRRRTRHASG